MGSFNPKNQTFLIAGSDGVVNISISLPVIDAQRVRLASICISYGVQLGLCLTTLIVLPLLTPISKMRKSVYIIHVSALVISVIRLTLLAMYFPGPLAEYYVAWTRDSNALTMVDYQVTIAANAFSVILFALIEASLIRQSWGLIKTWPDKWQWLIKGTSISLAVATISVKSIWVVRHTKALRYSTLPIPLDNVGSAATVLGAASIFYFCGIFFSNLVVHMMITRGILTRPGPGLTSLEILAIGNGTLMVLPCK
jgi:pheromone alpha factor receptor